MLGLAPFGHDLLRKYTALFGTLFNEITCPRYDASGSQTEALRVPLGYAEREKVMARLTADPDVDRPAAVMLPAMSFFLSNYVYAGDRKLNSVGRIIQENANTGVASSVFTPVPYDFEFTLWIYARNLEDGNRILEQVLPFFTPSFTIKASLVPEIGLVDMNIPVVLRGPVQKEDNWDGDYNERRAVVYTLEFTLKGWLYGPVANTGLIKFANVNFFDATLANDITTAPGNSQFKPIDRVTGQPGLDANGNPTTNVAVTIDYHLVKSTDPWEYIQVTSGILPLANTGSS